MTDRWTERSISDVTGKVSAVTGATSGLGRETARALAQHGAHVLVGGRNQAKARVAIDRIVATHTSGTLERLPVNLADLDSITGRVLPLLLSTTGSRVVNVSGGGHRPGRLWEVSERLTGVGHGLDAATGDQSR